MRPLFIGSYPHGALRMDLRTGTKEPRRRVGCSLPSWGITHKGQYLDKLFVQALVLVNHVGCDHNRGPLSRCDTQADAQSEYYQTPSDWYELNVAQVRRFQEAHSISFKRGAKEGSGGIERITLKDPLCFPFWAGESPQLVDEHGGFVDVQSQLDNWGFSGRIDDVLAILLPEPLSSSIQNFGTRTTLSLPIYAFKWSYDNKIKKKFRPRVTLIFRWSKFKIVGFWSCKNFRFYQFLRVKIKW